MKTKSFHRFWLLAIMLYSSIGVTAHDFEVGGIYYKITSRTDYTVAVSYRGNGFTLSYSNVYAGSVVIPENVTYNGNVYRVTSIGSSAFLSCRGLTSVIIPESVTSIDDSAFNDCSELSFVSLNCKEIGAWFSGMSSIKEITLGNSVTSIGQNAFWGCSGLTSVTIPNSITSIGSSAFSGCTSLSKAEFGSIESLCAIRFGNSSANPISYAGTLYIAGEEVTELVVPDCVTTIENYAMFGNTNLTSLTIGNAVTSIGESAFQGCTKLPRLIIPDCVIRIEDNAFRDCTGLINVSIGSGMKNIGKSAFMGCGKLTRVEYASIENLCGIQFGDAYANPLSLVGRLKINGKEITDLFVPNSVKTIGKYAFYGWNALTTASIGDEVESIDDQTFYGCTGLTSLYIGDGIKRIGNQSFLGCKNLSYVKLGNGATTIGGSAFENCNNLSYISLGNGIKSIGSNAFKNCYGLAMAEFASIESLCGIQFDDANANPLFYAHHLYIDGKEIIDLVIPETVTSISNYAFSRSTGLTSVRMGKGLISVGRNAFEGCSNLTSVHLSDLPAWCNISFENAESNPLTQAHKIYLNGGEVNNLIIPNNVPRINAYAFYGGTGLTSVNIGNGMTNIGYAAFSGCSALTSVSIGESVVFVDRDAFTGCNDLVKAEFSSIEQYLNKIEFSGGYKSTSNPLSIAHHLYIGGDEVTELFIPSSVTTIGDNAFSECSALTSAIIGNNVRNIGNNAFSECYGLTSVSIGANVTDIGCSAFTKCYGITSLKIPNNVKTIGEGAFAECSGLMSVIIGNRVTDIGDQAFENCKALTSIAIPKSVVTIGKYAFSGCSGLTTATIRGCSDSWESWQNLGDFPTYTYSFALWRYANQENAIKQEGVCVDFRQNTMDPSSIQIKLANWGKGVFSTDGVEVILEGEWNEKDQVYQLIWPETYTGYESSSYGPVFVSDLRSYEKMQGREWNYLVPCSYNPITYEFELQLGYYTSAGILTSGMEFMQMYIPNYSIAASYIETIDKSENEKYAVVDFTLGADVAFAKYAMTESSVSIKDVVASIINGELETTKITSSGRYYLDLTEEGRFCVTIVGYNDMGKALESDFCAFQFEKNDSWKSLGMCEYTDDFMTMGLYNEKTEEWSSTFGINAPVTYPVEVFAHTKYPGLYRLKNAYGEANPFNKEGDWDTSMDYFLEIDATQPEFVFINKQELGNNWSDMGMMSVESDGAYFMNAFDMTPEDIVAELTALGYDDPFGKFVNGVITFPAADIFTVYVGEDTYYGNHNGAFKVVLPNVANDEVVKFDKLSIKAMTTADNVFNEKYDSTLKQTPPKVVSASEENTIVGLTSIGDYAFNGCIKISSINIGDGVKSIGKSTFYGCSEISALTIGRGITFIGESAFGSSNQINQLLVKCSNPPSAANVFSGKTYDHTTLYVPIGKVKDYEDDATWYRFYTIKEAVLEETETSVEYAYTLMEASTFQYAVYDAVNDCIMMVTASNVDENNPNHCWQTVEVSGKKFLYNIGAKKFAVPSTDGSNFRLSAEVGSISMEDGDDGIVIAGNTAQQWALIVDTKMDAYMGLEEVIMTGVKSIDNRQFMNESGGKAERTTDNIIYDFNGRRQPKMQKGLNIIKYADGSVKRIMERK